MRTLLSSLMLATFRGSSLAICALLPLNHRATRFHRRWFAVASSFILSLGLAFTDLRSAPAADAPAAGIQKPPGTRLENPMSVAYLRERLRKDQPRIILTAASEELLKAKLKTDPACQSLFRSVELEAARILQRPHLTRKMEGRRLLAVSHEMFDRVCVLGLVYRVEKSPLILKRLDEELNAVCRFSDWNHAHFLDVSVMSFAVALALDWAGGDLPEATVALGKAVLIDKGLGASYRLPHGGSFAGRANHNQVDNAGMVAAAIAVAEVYPELASKALSRSLNGIPNALKAYGPDGVYPEGPSYWDYGTSFSGLTSSMLTSAFGTDFGLAAYPAFLASAQFRLLAVGPSGRAFNFFDCEDVTPRDAAPTLLWFALKTGNSTYYDRSYFEAKPEDRGLVDGLAAVSLIWLAQYQPSPPVPLPRNWKGDGPNPVVFFRGGGDPGRYYFGSKGGSAGLDHGNMDAGSFIFELDGVRWVIDPGNQNYHELEKAGLDLWNLRQDSERWTLLTKGNHGHSTLTLNRERHRVEGSAPITSFTDGPMPEATLDLTAVLGAPVTSATRRFVKDSARSLFIEDKFELSTPGHEITWGLMTTATVELHQEGAMLRQDGKVLHLEVLSPLGLTPVVIPLDPPPLKLDRRIKGLKRIELRAPVGAGGRLQGEFMVRLTGG